MARINPTQYHRQDQDQDDAIVPDDNVAMGEAGGGNQPNGGQEQCGQPDQGQLLNLEVQDADKQQGQ